MGYLGQIQIQIGRLTMEIFKKFTFDAAHYLPNAPEGHKCGRMHGHTYVVIIHVSGEIDPSMGWVLDFADIKKAFAPLLETFDHYLLNEIEGLEIPTSENIAIYIWQKLQPSLPGLSKIIVQENDSSGAIYTGPSNS